MKAIAIGVRWVGVLILSCWTALPSCAETLVENIAGQNLGDAQWIWSPAHSRNEVPVGDCYFRKSFKLGTPEVGEVQITADNQFQLFVNGQPVGQGADWRQLEVYDISKHLKKGVNTIAVQVTNIDEGSAGLVARVLVKETGGTFTSYYSTPEGGKILSHSKLVAGGAIKFYEFEVFEVRDGKVTYTQLVPEIKEAPDYDGALAAVR